MNILAFDTCFDACSAAVRTGAAPADQKVFHRFEPMQTGHAERLVPMISELLSQARIAMADIELIAVTTGPGTFTGTRICVAAARAFALAHEIVLAPLSSLALIARQAACAAPQARDLCVAVDARHNEVYIQIFDREGLAARGSPQIMALDEARALVERSGAMVIGSGASLLDPALLAPLAQPDARYALDIVSRNHQPTRAIAPLYLRSPDAKPLFANMLQRQ